jgi:hypothetical protein
MEKNNPTKRVGIILIDLPILSIVQVKFYKDFTKEGVKWGNFEPQRDEKENVDCRSKLCLAIIATRRLLLQATNHYFLVTFSTRR